MRGFNPNSNKGFSIIELMIVVAIIGILAAVAVPSYLKHVHRTRQAEGVHRLLDIKTAQEKYYALNDVYFTVAGALSTSTDEEFNGMLNFVVTGTEFHDFAITSTDPTANFRAELFSDLDGKDGAQMCWVMIDSDTAPARLDDADADAVLGTNCDGGPDAEKLGFSTMFF